MDNYPPAVQRRISRLRWTAGLIWVIWLLAAVPFYWLFRFAPHTFKTTQLIVACTAALGLGAIWFIYIIYRIGELAGSEHEEE